MTAFTTAGLAEILVQYDYMALTVRLSLFAFVPLTLLLLERELLAAREPARRDQPSLGWLAVISAPLLAMTAIALTIRLAALLGYL